MLKKILAGVVAVSLLLTSMVAFAAELNQPDWKFTGYDITQAPDGPYAKIWNEYVFNGVQSTPTGAIKQEGFANLVEWKFDFYERDYPHAGYEIGRAHV